MIKDIEGRDINVGDECIFSSNGWLGITKVKITRFTAGRVFYTPYNSTSKQYNNSYDYYINRSSQYCKFYKIC